MKNQLFTLAALIITSNMIMITPTFSQEVLDKGLYRFYYDYAFEFDTLTLNDSREDLIILQVGQNISKSYSYYTFRSDSLRTMPDGRNVFREAMRRTLDEAREKGGRPQNPYSRRKSGVVYKNYPQGQMTATDAINLDYYKYNDELHSQDWQFIDSTIIILDYPCQMAVNDFRGRRWTAWFAPDIPISDGPWKFSGLPGLIMEVYDSERHFHFTLVGIEQVEDDPIVFSPVVLSNGSLGNYEKTTRMEFIRGLARFRGNTSSIMNAELGKDTFDESSSNVRHNDLMERDYR